MKSIYKFAIAVLTLPIMLVSCSDNDDYEPGPAPAEDCMSVYFPIQASYNYEFLADEDCIVPVKVKRAESAEAATIPLTVTANEDSQGAFVIPSQVEFAAGEKEAVFNVDCSNLPLRAKCSFTVKIPEEYVNPYSEGTADITVYASIIGAWELWAENVPFEFQDKYNTVYSDIYAMRGTGKFKIENFIGSGVDLPFVVNDPAKDYAIITPTANYDDYSNYVEQDDFNCWYFYDSENDYWPSWSPDGVTFPGISYALVYGYDDSYAYTYMRLSKNEGRFYFSMTYDDGTFGWNYVDFSYEPLVDPFE
uniref:hypothetical protein n=1 Tax=uncultured Muribaculum sp. TaxID=1918613 RepID=UPI0025B6F157|nr:hypothetical protein [uncultured Muribaculum sp.]